MTLKKIHDDQPKEFKFSSENFKKAEEILKKYPKENKKSAVMPFLYLAQRILSDLLSLKFFILFLYISLTSGKNK